MPDVLGPVRKDASLFPILLLHLHENHNAYAEHRSVKIPAPYIYIYICVFIEKEIMEYTCVRVPVRVCVCTHLNMVTE